MDYVTTNIRLPEDIYLQLKQEAAKQRKTLSVVIRERLHAKMPQEKSPEDILKETKRLAKENALSLKGFDIVKALREMRYENS